MRKSVATRWTSCVCSKKHAVEPPLGRQVLAAHNCVLLTGSGNRLTGFGTWDDDCMKSIGYQSMSWPTTMPGGTIAIPSPSRVRSFWPPRANAWRFPKPSSSVSPAPTLNGTNFHIKPAWQAEIKRMLMSGLTYDRRPSLIKTFSTSRRNSNHGNSKRRTGRPRSASPSFSSRPVVSI